MNYQTTVFLKNYYLQDSFTEETHISLSSTAYLSDSSTALSVSFNGVSFESSTLSFSTEFSESISYSEHSSVNQNGEYFLTEGTTQGRYVFGETSFSDYLNIRKTIISNFAPLFATTFADENGESTEASSSPISVLSYKESYVSENSFDTTSETSSSSLSSEFAASISSFLETYFASGELTVNKAYIEGISTKYPISTSTIFSSNNKSFSQIISDETTSQHDYALYESSYSCSSDFPVQFWFLTDSPLALSSGSTNFSLLNEIANSETSFSTVSSIFEYTFAPISSTYENESFSSTIGVDSSYFLYETLVSSTSTAQEKNRDGSLSDITQTFFVSTESSFSDNGTFVFSWETNQNASYYNDISYKSIFEGFISNLFILNGTTSYFLNFGKTSYQEIPVKVSVGIASNSVLSSSSEENSASFSAGNLFSSSSAKAASSYVAASETSRLFRRGGLVSVFSTSSPVIFDISFNGGFCGFVSTDENIYKNLLINKKYGDGTIFIENDRASVCPNIRNSIASYNFTSFVNDCWTSSTIEFSETIIKKRYHGFIDSSFKITSGGSFTVDSNNQLINLGGKESSLSIETNETLASYFSYSLVDGSYLTQILELILEDPIQNSEKTSWKQFRTNSSYYQFNTNGSLALYPGAGYFLTIKRGNAIDYSSYIINPISAPTFLSFDKEDGFAITTAKLFAKGLGEDFSVSPFVFLESSD